MDTHGLITNPIPRTNVGVLSTKQLSPFQTLLVAYRDRDRLAANNPEFPTKPWLFKEIANAMWGDHNKYRRFIWHPWAEAMNEAFHTHKYLAVAGSGSSGKSEMAAIYALINWLCDPPNTLVLMTSTSIKDSRKRIWGSLVSYFVAAGGESNLPGKLVDSLHQIRTDDGSGVFTDRSGCAIIAGEKKKEKESIGKLIGIKAPRIILIADELPELSEAIVEAAMSNLSLNPSFQMIGLGNLYSMYDPLGSFVTPKDGWATIDSETDEWETAKGGYCLRLDGEKSPNVMAGEDIWPIYNNRNLKEHREKLGANTIGYWRMCRSFIPPIGSENCIYSDADFRAGDALSHVTFSVPPVRLCALDPNFTAGGDRSVAYLGSLGMDLEGTEVLHYDHYKALREDARISDEPRSQQIASQFIRFCMDNGVPPENAAVDTTGGGRVIYDIICERWGTRKVLAVEFGGSASAQSINLSGTLAKDAYSNRVSELWYVGLEFMRSGQLKGMPPELINELKARRFNTIKKDGVKVKVEAKGDMRRRLGFSPDIADASVILLALARERHGFTAKSGTLVKATNRESFLEVAQRFDRIYQEANTFAGDD